MLIVGSVAEFSVQAPQNEPFSEWQTVPNFSGCGNRIGIWHLLALQLMRL